MPDFYVSYEEWIKTVATLRSAANAIRNETAKALHEVQLRDNGWKSSNEIAEKIRKDMSDTDSLIREATNRLEIIASMLEKQMQQYQQVDEDVSRAFDL